MAGPRDRRANRANRPAARPANAADSHAWPDQVPHAKPGLLSGQSETRAWLSATRRLPTRNRRRTRCTNGKMHAARRPAAAHFGCGIDSAMRIRSLTAYVVRLPLKRPFKHASTTRHESDNVLIRCELADGTTGWGEGVPRSYVTGETPDGC